MKQENIPQLIQALLDPAVYPHEVDEVRLIQTHISFVLLAGDYVYKIKKPVDFGFLNFTSLERRRFFCSEELRLNRRLCPTLYLKVLPVNKYADTFNLAGPGETVEYCLKMVRMPEEKMMANVIKGDGIDKEQIDAIVDILVPFYEKADRDCDISKFGRAESVAVNVLENFEQTNKYVGGKVLSQKKFEQISAYSRNFLKQEELFAQRIAEGRICDCHGDLYSANICLAEEIFVFDCIEFNKRFRYCDVASDVAFLAMDLDYQGMEQLSSYLIGSFRDKSGDKNIDQLLDFYKCYRAYVRGKIGLFTAHSPEVDNETKQTCLKQAGKYFTLAQRYAAHG